MKEKFTYEPMEPEEKTSSKIITFIIFWIVVGAIVWILGIMYP